MPYSPLHVHSTNSPGTGLMTPSEIAERAAFLGMPAIALTDEWNTYGHYEFSKVARAGGIRPVLGAEIAHLSLTGHDGVFHLTLLAEDNEGYTNLCRLVSLHHDKEEGPPHITVEELVSYSEGLIVLTGCIRGEASQAVLHGNLGMQRQAVEKLAEIFGRGRTFLEVMTHNSEREQLVLDKTVMLSQKIGIPMVVTNNDRFLSRDDVQYYEVLRNLFGERREETPETFSEYFLKSRKDLEPYFYFMEEALEISGEIASRCAVDLIDGATISFTDDPAEDVTLSEKCNRRFILEFHAGASGGGVFDLKNRMMMELERASVEEMSGFLLFLERLFRRCRREGVWIELVGSDLCQSVIAYLLGIVPLNPAEHGLVFESFGAPAPGVPPGVDLLRARGPSERLLRILSDELKGSRFHFQLQRDVSSFATLVKELAEKYGLARPMIDEILQATTAVRKTGRLADVLENSETLSHLYNTDKTVRKILHSASALQGRVSHFKHNASRKVVLPSSAERMAASAMGEEGEDFLMLDGEAISAFGGWMLVVQQSHFLSALAITVANIRTPETGAAGPGESENRQDKVEQWRPRDLNDLSTFDMIARGDTTGVYQLESRGMRDLLIKIAPQNFEDLVNAISLYRPAPLEGKLWQKYVENAEKKGKVYLPHHSLAGPLEMTRGLLLYKEQVREILLESAGLTAQDTAFVERALDKKGASELQAARLIFIRGAMERDIDEEDAQKVFDYLLHNIGFTFAKVFSCTQAYVSYRSAFLKAHHAAAYFAALLESTGDVKERKIRYLEYLDDNGPAVFPPDVNFSGSGFLAEKDAIRAPMQETCDMTGDEIEAILGERGDGGAFGSLQDFLTRMTGKLSMETAVKMAAAGLFDSFGEVRKSMQEEILAFYDEHGRVGEFFRAPAEASKPKDKDDGQLSLFDD